MLFGSLPEISRRVETDHFGSFVFQLGFIVGDVILALQRVEDAHERFLASPLSEVANRLEQEVVVSSVFGTNTIEGGTLTEDETANALVSDPDQIQAIEQRRVLNIKAAYDLSQTVAKSPGWGLTMQFIIDLHNQNYTKRRKNEFTS
jgi:hypothetical protein